MTNLTPEKAKCSMCREFYFFEEFPYFDLVQLCNTCLPSTFVGYIAGFFDGEGHVELRPRRSAPHRISFAQATDKPLHEIAFRFPGGIIYHQNNDFKGIYNLVYNGRNALPLCRIMLPHLIVKASEVESYLKLFNANV